MYPNRTFVVEKAVPHPLYDNLHKASHHDVALLRLQRNVDFISNEIVPIYLPLENHFQDLWNSVRKSYHLVTL